jgi:hypothetical protein
MKAYLLAPAFTLGYGIVRIIDGLDGQYGPGPAWTIGHLAFLAGLAFFVPVLLDLRRRADHRPVAGYALALLAPVLASIVRRIVGA